jgi:hypothetical protein
MKKLAGNANPVFGSRRRKVNLGNAWLIPSSRLKSGCCTDPASNIRASVACTFEDATRIRAAEKRNGLIVGIGFSGKCDMRRGKINIR